MFVDLSFLFEGCVVAVALSGGSDSMALLHYLNNAKTKFGFSVKAINIEHGIRGKSSVSDSAFVKDYCDKIGVPILTYSVDSLSFAKTEKLTVEQAARILRYDCFSKAIESGYCNLIATAHHLKDNLETVLLNMFRGTGLKGLKGITEYKDKIVRPFLGVKKSEIDEYIKENSIPFVVDETNDDEKYSRNYIRKNIIDKIEKIFPDADKSVYRLSLTAKEEDEYLDGEADKILTLEKNKARIRLPSDKVLISRATIKALKHLSLSRDWEKTHIDAVISLSVGENGKRINLPKNITAHKEYDEIVFINDKPEPPKEIPFKEGTFEFSDGVNLTVKSFSAKDTDLKTGLFLDAEKIPDGTVVRTKRDGDIFHKFGGGTKSLSDYFTDKKIPLRLRDTIPLVCYNNEVLAIFGMAISDTVKSDKLSDKIYKITKE